MAWQWHQLDHMQIICTSLQTDNHTSTSPLSFHRPDALPAAQPTVSKHWRQIKAKNIQQQQSFHGSLSGTTGWAGTTRNIHPPTILIIIQSLSASSIYYDPQHPPCFFWRAWQSFCTTSLHILFGLPLGLEPSTSYSIHIFTQSVSSFRNTCPYHRNLFCSSIKIISSIYSIAKTYLFNNRCERFFIFPDFR